MQLDSPGRLGDQEPDDLCRDLGHTLLFFANLRKRLSLEIERTNCDQSDSELWIGTSTNEAQLREAQAVMGQNVFSSRKIELRSAKSDTCAVVLVVASPHVEVLLGEGQVREPGKMMVFIVQDRSGTKAHRMDLEPLPYALHEMDVDEIARKIVSGVNRGNFD